MRYLLSVLACVTGTAYGVDVMLPSDVSVGVNAEPSSDLQPGQPIRLTITVTNNGPAVLENFAVESAWAAPDQIDVRCPDTDCVDFHFEILDGATTFWYIEVWYPTDTNHGNPGTLPLAVGESRSCHVTIRLMPTADQSVPFDFHLPTYWGDPNPSNNVGQVTLQRSAPVVAPVPIASTAANACIALVLLLLGWVALDTRGLLRTHGQ